MMTEEPPRNVPVTFNPPPSDSGALPLSGYIADTPETREALEAAAIPRCREWREANPEPLEAVCDVPWHDGHMDTRSRPAPYCCSAYCDRCAGLRALDGEPPLLPNEWMTP